MVFNIQRYSTHDGEGIRTMVFYKGCTLRCQWCSNPESQSFLSEIMLNQKSCKRFGDCFKILPGAITLETDGIHINRSVIHDPLPFKDLCAAKALTVSGEDRSVAEILSEIEKDIPFYNRSNGGVTLSGGEPLAQGTELTGLLSELRKRKLDVVVETSLHVAWTQVERCLGYIGTWLVDLKHTDMEKFRRYTTGDAHVVMDNLKRLAELGESIIIRIPVIPGFNHTDKEIKSMIDFAAILKGVSEIHFIPYHTLGTEKYTMLGMKYDFEAKKAVDPVELTTYIKYANVKGFKTRIGG